MAKDTKEKSDNKGKLEGFLAPILGKKKKDGESNSNVIIDNKPLISGDGSKTGYDDGGKKDIKTIIINEFKKTGESISKKAEKIRAKSGKSSKKDSSKSNALGDVIKFALQEFKKKDISVSAKIDNIKKYYNSKYGKDNAPLTSKASKASESSTTSGFKKKLMAFFLIKPKEEKKDEEADIYKQYKYTAYNLQKEKFSGIFIAMDEKDLAMQLSKQGLFLISCKIYTGGTPSAFWTTGTGEITMDELALFCRQYSILITSGMSMMESLETVKGQQFSGYFKSILEVIYEDVKSGQMLSEAVNKHEKVFPSFFRSMIGVGESSGKMDVSFNALADYYENESQTKKELKSALSYPLFLIGITVVVFIAMMFYIVPKFKDALSSLEVTPIKMTQIIYDMSDYLIANWMMMVIIVIFVIGGIFFYSRTKKGRYNFDKLKITMPLLKTINIDMITARFARSFAILLSSGLNIADALDAVQVIFGNLDVERRFAMAKEDVRVGIPLSKALAKYKIFPEMLIQMIVVGEKTATIENVLLKCCDYFDRQAHESISKFTGAITPIILCFMGGVLACMFIAIYSPIISIMQAF